MTAERLASCRKRDVGVGARGTLAVASTVGVGSRGPTTKPACVGQSVVGVGVGVGVGERACKATRERDLMI